MSAPTAYPLHWPRGWPRTPERERDSGKQFNMSLEGALASLRKEVERLGGSGVVLSSNYTLGVNRPEDPGVVAYFTYDKAQVAIPCDRWGRIEANVRAIALTIEAMRGMERWGAKHMIKAMFSGFKALMPPGGASTRPWHEVLAVRADAPEALVRSSFRDLAKMYHPDNGGTQGAMAELNAAWEEAKRERGWR